MRVVGEERAFGAGGGGVNVSSGMDGLEKKMR